MYWREKGTGAGGHTQEKDRSNKKIETMKKIWAYLRAHWAEDRQGGLYVSTAIFITLCIWVNYWGFGWWIGKAMTLERYLIQTFSAPESWWALPIYFTFYAFPYMIVMALTWFFKKERRAAMHERILWEKVLLVLVVLTIGATNHWYLRLTEGIATLPERYWAMKMVAPMIPLAVVGVPLLVYWWVRERHSVGAVPLYGLRWKGFDWRTYSLLLLLLLPLLVAASFQAAFIHYYPTLKMHRMEGFGWMPHWAAYTLYELVYGAYFLWAEWLLRGFLVLSLGRILGSSSVLPMVALYAFLHFDKPMGETISSVFGGYLLGTIALRSGNVLGGVFVHAGIAVGMDLLALGQWWWRGQ